MGTRRKPRSGIEDRWYPTVVVTDPVTGTKSKKKVKSAERFGKGKRWRARYVDPNGVERPLVLRHRGRGSVLARQRRDDKGRDWDMGRS